MNGPRHAVQSQIPASGTARKKRLHEMIEAAQAHQIAPAAADQEPSLATIRTSLLPEPPAGDVAQVEPLAGNRKVFGWLERRKARGENRAAGAFETRPATSAI